MPLPTSARDLVDDAQVISNDLTAISAAIAALPATPLEADLPDIVQIVADLNSAATAMQGIVAEVLTVLSTTRVNQ
jgi:hypothetical protein